MENDVLYLIGGSGLVLTTCNWFGERKP